MKRLPKRKSLRLKDYNYSRPGYYYITVCLQNRECLFGEVVEGKMVLNDVGGMMNKWWLKIPLRFKSVALDEYQIMPNHLHGIIVICNEGARGGSTHGSTRTDLYSSTHGSTRTDLYSSTHGSTHSTDLYSIPVGADPCVHPVGANQCVCPKANQCVCPKANQCVCPKANQCVCPNSPQLSKIIQWFKTMTTNHYIRNVKNNNWPRFEKRFWQRNFYEHIIRNEKSLNKIREYIQINPQMWHKDKENPKILS